MTRFGLMLLLAPAALAAQQRATFTSAVTMEIRSRNQAAASEVSVRVEGDLFASLGVLRPAPGRVDCAGSGCAATTPAILELTDRPGHGRLTTAESAPELEVTVIQAGRPNERVVAVGHEISFARDSTGRLTVLAPRMVPRP